MSEVQKPVSESRLEGNLSDQNRQGQLVIVSGPSGVGKTTVLKSLFQNCPLPLEMSVSATTRGRRPGEAAGVSYYFLTEAEFAKRRENGDFLESCEVFGRGHWYGTLRQPVETALTSGKWIVLDVDIEGAAKVLQSYPDAITIFIHPGSLDELEKRLRNRGTESESAIARRLEVAAHELQQASQYQHLIVNGLTVEHAATEICTILQTSGEKN
jgi:guanylate kinase